MKGGYNEGGSEDSANVDVVPIGKDRFPVITGQMKTFDFDEDSFYPAKEAIDMYHRYKEDIALFGEMGFKTYRLSILLVVFFQKGTNKNQMKTAWKFKRISSKNVINMVLNHW